MKTTIRTLLLLSLLHLCGPSLLAAGALPVFPLKVSENRRHLVDQQGTPFLYQADTPWTLFTKLTEMDAKEYITRRKQQGFTALQVTLTHFLGTTNRAGELPFAGTPPEQDFAQPNEKFFAHVDRVVREAQQQSMLLAIAPAWSGCCGEGWAGSEKDGSPKPLNKNGVEKSRALGRWLGERYGKFNHVMWILGGDIDPDNARAEIRALAIGLKDTAPQQLITYHASSSHSSTDVWPADEPWLDVSMVYTYFRGFSKAWNRNQPDVYEVSHVEFAKVPIRPILLGESTYEGEHGAWGSAVQARKQAYWCVLGGGCGHAYGSPNWNFPNNWREVLEQPGALSLKHLRALLESRPWWKLLPDAKNIVAVEGRGAFATNDYALTALAHDGSFALSYLPTRRTLTIDLTKLSGERVGASWFNPRTGEATRLGEFTDKNRRAFDPPSDGDWVLVLDDAAKRFPPPGQAEAESASGHSVASIARFKTIPVGTRPESVTKGFGGHYYVTVMGDQQSGDAVIKVIKGNQIEVFANGLDEPKGIAFVGGFLVTTDLKRVWKIDAQGNKTVLAEEKDFPKPVSYLNDTAAAPDGRGVFVTDMGARDKIMGPDGLWPLDSAESKSLPAIGRIYHIGLDGRVSLVVDAAPQMACPNGVCAPVPDRLLIAEFFHGKILEARSGKLETLTIGFRGADGIERARSGELFVSSWTQGKVWRMDSRGQNPQVVAAGLQSAADFHLDEDARLLLVPDMKAGTLVCVPLP